MCVCECTYFYVCIYDKTQCVSNKDDTGVESRRGTVFNVGDTVLVVAASGTDEQVVNNLERSTRDRSRGRSTHSSSRYVRACVAEQSKRKPQQVHVGIFLVRFRRFTNAPLGTAADAESIEKAARRDFPDNIPEKLVEDKCA